MIPKGLLRNDQERAQFQTLMYLTKSAYVECWEKGLPPGVIQDRHDAINKLAGEGIKMAAIKLPPAVSVNLVKKWHQDVQWEFTPEIQVVKEKFFAALESGNLDEQFAIADAFQKQFRTQLMPYDVGAMTEYWKDQYKALGMAALTTATDGFEQLQALVTRTAQQKIA